MLTFHPDANAERAPWCGGTDAAAIVCSAIGQPYYRSAWEVWAERYAPDALPPRRPTDSLVLDIGTALEPLVLDYYGRQLPDSQSVQAGGRVTGPQSYPWMRGQLDGVVRDTLAGVVGLVDAKTSRQSHHWSTEVDGERVDTLPAGYEVQVRWYMGLCRLTGHPVEWADVAALDLLSARLHVRRLDHDDGKWGGILGIVIPWWERHIIGGERPPDDHSACCERWHLYCRPIDRESAVATPEQAAKVAQWVEVDRESKAADEAAKALRAEVAAMLPAERLYMTEDPRGPYIQRQRAGKSGWTVRAYRFPTEESQT